MIAGGSKCVFAGGDHGPCDGRLEFHHCIKQQRLKRIFKYGAWRFTSDEDVWIPTNRYGAPTVVPVGIETRTLDDILGDTRNRVWLCHRHHELVTNGRLKVELPESVFEFADEFGLRGMLENDLRRAA